MQKIDQHVHKPLTAGSCFGPYFWGPLSEDPEPWSGDKNAKYALSDTQYIHIQKHNIQKFVLHKETIIVSYLCSIILLCLTMNIHIL